MSKYYEIPKTQVKEGIKIALENSRDLIHEGLTLLENFAVSFHVLGMYTFALEEYGKALILEENLMTTENNCKVPKEIFYKHSKKFEKALNAIPHNCKNVFVETESFVNSTKKSKMVKSRKGDEYELGAGHAMVLTEPMLADFESRLNCFYLGWDSKNKIWKNPPSPEFLGLEETLKEFFKILLDKLQAIENDSKKS